MKKLFAGILAIALVFCCAVSAAAATKQELIDEFSKIPSSKYVITSIKNLSATVDITDAQGDQIMAIVKELQTEVPADLGQSASSYSQKQIDDVFDALDQFCDVTKMTYKIDSAQSFDGTSSLLTFYDSSNKVVCSYSNGVVKTGVDNSFNTAYIWLGASVVVLGAAVAVYFVARKKKVTE